jgi:hypothetical protein
MHKQPPLFAVSMKEPRLFLGTMPAPISSSKEDARHRLMWSEQEVMDEEVYVSLIFFISKVNYNH